MKRNIFVNAVTILMLYLTTCGCTSSNISKQPDEGTVKQAGNWSFITHNTEHVFFLAHSEETKISVGFGLYWNFESSTSTYFAEGAITPQGGNPIIKQIKGDKPFNIHMRFDLPLGEYSIQGKFDKIMAVELSVNNPFDFKRIPEVSVIWIGQSGNYPLKK